MKVFPAYKAAGKEVIRTSFDHDKRCSKSSHYADAIDNEAAIAIAYALNSVFLAELGPSKACKNCGGEEVHKSYCGAVDA